MTKVFGRYFDVSPFKNNKLPELWGCFTEKNISQDMVEIFISTPGSSFTKFIDLEG